MNYRQWIYGNDCGCGCNDSSRRIDNCDCDNILLEISNLHTDDAVISAAVDNKQDKLIAGDNITIVDNVISSTGGGGDLTNYYTKEEVDVLIPTEVSELTNDAGYITNADLSDEYATKQWVENKNYLTDADLSNYALKSDIPVVPTSNSAFINDMHYVTSDETYSKIEVDNIVDNKFWCGNQQEYDALPTKDNNVLYLIHE